MSYKFIDDLFSAEELEVYHKTLFPFNLPLVKETLDKKLEEDPDYEVFLPFYYRRIDNKLKGDSLKLINPSYLFISNKGRIISNNIVEEFREIPRKDYPDKYSAAYIAISGDTYTISIHRAVACVFIPVPTCHLSAGLHPKDLEVNHINGDKLDWSIGNLEWSTTKENVNHAFATGLMKSGEAHKDTKPVKGRVIRGKFIGFEFVLFGGNNLEQYGFDQAATSNAAHGKLKSHGNCKWVFATEEDIANLPRVIPEDIAQDLKDTCPIAKYRTIGTNIETGEVVEFIGKKQCKVLGFNPEAIGNMIAGRTASHKGHTWRYELLETEL